MNGFGPDPGLEIRRLREAMPDRRERIATVCMAALLTKYGVGPEDEKHSAYAVAFADALIAELDKPKEVKP